jgi:hypothetical protein
MDGRHKSRKSGAFKTNVIVLDTEASPDRSFFSEIAWIVYSSEGSLKEVNEFLVRLGVVEAKRDPLDLEWFYLTDEVADFTWHLVNLFIVRVGDSLAGDEKEKFKSATLAPHHLALKKAGADSLETPLLAVERRGTQHKS